MVNTEPTEADLRRYEGLVFKTAQIHAPKIEEEPEDIRQILRIKVWHALTRYDPSRSGMSVDRYVFMVLTNQVKDLKKRKRRGELFIDDVAPQVEQEGGSVLRDSFDHRYLSDDHEQVYGDIEDDDLVIPSTLSRLERVILALLHGGYRQTEIADRLALGPRDVERSVRALRDKLADWKPDSPPEPVAPTRERERQAA